MSWTPTTRNIRAEIKLIDLERKLKGLSSLLFGLESSSMSPTGEELQGVGLILEGLSKDLREIYSKYLLCEARTGEPSEANDN